MEGEANVKIQDVPPGYRLTEVAKHLKRDPANVSTLMLRLGNRIEGVMQKNRP